MLSSLLDCVVPAAYKSSDINTLAAAMVVDAEAQLGGGEVPAALRVLEGESLHALYASASSGSCSLPQ